MDQGPSPEANGVHNNFKIHFSIASHLNLGLKNGPFPSGFCTKTLCAFLLFSMLKIFPASIRQILLNMHHIEKYDSDFTIRHFLIYVFR